jgi:methylmalonyl-CoA mutase C-terminal domain/subunit
MIYSPKTRLLIGKPGLDGHDRGAKYVAQILRDAGFEVIYTGIRRTPEQIVETAIQEDVAGIGLSLLSGAHLVLFAQVIALLKDRGADDIIVFGGGTIPPNDVPRLMEMGVAAVFTPGTSARQIVDAIDELLMKHESV